MGNRKGVIPWNKGKTKLNDSGVKKISDTMKNKKIDNFKNKIFDFTIGQISDRESISSKLSFSANSTNCSMVFFIF